MRPTRRRVLGWAALGVAGGLAGCGGEDPPPGLYASDAQVVYRSGDDRFDYPEDVGVRVSVENTSSDRLEGTLRTTLECVDGSGATPAVLETWTRQLELSLGRGSSRAVFVVFEDVVDGEKEPSFRARAEII